MAPTTGWLANPGQPYARQRDLTVCADYNTCSGRAYYKNTATTGNTSFTGVNTSRPSRSPRA